MTRTFLYIGVLILATACASGQQTSQDPKVEPQAPTPAVTSTAPAAAEAAAVTVAPTPPDVKAQATHPPTTSRTWRLKGGKLSGPGALPAGKQLSKVKNDKTPGHTTETCYSYGEFSIVEMRSTDEIGAAELTIRYADPANKNLCAKEFKGKSANVRLIEGYFAGVAGEYMLVDGADSSEGLTQFQIIHVPTGKETMKSYHHPTEEFSITGTGHEYSLNFFAKAQVKCELANAGAPCWKDVLKLNKVSAATAMPDCKSMFAKSNTPLTEPALVTIRSQVARLSAPKPVFVGGRATCAPAP